MSLLSWTAAAYVLLLPHGYRLASQSVEHVEGPGGLGSAVETVCVWQDPAGGSVTFLWWKPYPPRPGGPLVAAREVPGPWAGAPASFIETTMFSGAAARVSVAFQKRAEFGGRARISATGLDLETLQTLLAAAQVGDLTPDQAGQAGCGSAEGMAGATPARDRQR